MQLRLCLLAIVTCAGLSAPLWADEPAAFRADEKANTPVGNFTIVDSDWTGTILPGQFLARIAFGNQLGIEVAPVEPPLRAHLDLKEGQGVVVTGAAAASDAAKVGLVPHDVVLEIDGQQITSPEKFHEIVGSKQGKKAVLQVVRKGEPSKLEVTFPETPVYQFANQQVANNVVGWTPNQYRIGVTLAQADDVLRTHLHLAEGQGLVVTEVVSDGPSAKAGLRKHDVLVKLDGKPLNTVDAFNTQIQEIKDRQVTATLFRGGKEMSLEIKPQLSSTAEWTISPASTLFLNNGVAPNQPWVARFNLNTLQVDPLSVWQPGVRWQTGNNMRDLIFSNPAAGAVTATAPTTATSAADQISQLKRQLDEMQKSLSALEATLRSAKPEQPPQTDKPQ